MSSQDLTDWFEVEQRGECLILGFTETWLQQVTPALASLREPAEALLDRSGSRWLVFDFSEYYDRPEITRVILSSLIVLRKVMHDRQGDLRVCGLDSRLRDVFQVTKLDSLIALFETRDQAADRGGPPPAGGPVPELESNSPPPSEVDPGEGSA